MDDGLHREELGAAFGPGGCVRREPFDAGTMCSDPCSDGCCDRNRDLNDYAAESHADNAQWWMDMVTGERLERNKGELLALIHSEISECLEGVRKNLMDDKLPHRKMEEVELADALIRIFDYAGAHGLDIEGAYQEKRAYNAGRADHKIEARLAADGKKF